MNKRLLNVQRARRKQDIQEYYHQKIAQADTDTVKEILYQLIFIIVEGANDEELEKWHKWVLLEKTGEKEKEDAEEQERLA